MCTRQHVSAKAHAPNSSLMSDIFLRKVVVEMRAQWGTQSESLHGQHFPQMTRTEGAFPHPMQLTQHTDSADLPVPTRTSTLSRVTKPTMSFMGMPFLNLCLAACRCSCEDFTKLFANSTRTSLCVCGMSKDEMQMLLTWLVVDLYSYRAITSSVPAKQDRWQPTHAESYMAMILDGWN